MRYLLILALILCAAPAWAMEHHIDTLQDRQGNAIGGVTVTVYQAGTLTLATIFSDNGVTAKSNPFPSDANGYYDFYASNGVYDFTFVRSGFTFPQAFTRIALFDVNDGGGGGGSSSFSGLLSGTNNAAAMIVGTGASLTATGSGSINATLFKGLATVAVADGGTNLTAALDDNLMLGNGTTWQSKAVPSCSNGTTSKLLYDISTNTFSCGTDQGSSGGTFDTIGSGTNITASMTVGSGATLTFSGSGILNASSFRGNTVTTPVDGGTGLSTVADDTLLIANGSLYQAKTLPACNNPTTSKLLYDTGTNEFACGVDQSAGGGTTFDTIGSGTNTTMAALVGTGASLGVTGTGAITSTTFWPMVVTVNAGNSPYTALTADATILCDTTSAARIVNLPAATVQALLTFVNLGSNTCTINRAGADTITTGITSSSSFIIRNAGSTFWLQPNGASVWYVGG